MKEKTKEGIREETKGEFCSKNSKDIRRTRTGKSNKNKSTMKMKTHTDW
jgi:hypothetical protein